MQNPTHTCPQCHSPIPADAPGGLCPACVLLGVAGPTNPSQASAANAPTIEEVAAAFPELEILALIGQGGMGVVFKARQPRLDRLVALKILPPALAAQPGFAERFTREARVLAKLAHPHIVAIYDFGESAGFFYLIMEFVNGVNLRAAMRAGVTPEQALLLVPHICEALQFAHDHGVLHRDIKPENILLDTAGTPKLADFGIAKLIGDGSNESHATHATHASHLTATGAALGTAAYMAPEQVEKPATVDHRADIYSLGVVFYEMLTGELPLGRFAAPSEKSSVNRGVDEVVMRALEKERERRQQSATEMKTEVEHATQNAARAPARPPNTSSPWSHRLFWLIIGLLALPVVLIIAGLFVWMSSGGGGVYGFGPGEVMLLLFVLPVSVLAALIFGYRRTRPAADLATPPATWNPWPKRVFLLLVALIVVPAVLIGLGLAVPMLAYRSLERQAPATNANPATVEVHFGKADPSAPGTHKLTLNSRTPHGWVTDFSFRIRDENGEREMPAASFIVARQKPPKSDGNADFKAGVSWEFSTGDRTDGTFVIEAALSKGSAGQVSSSSTGQPRDYRWESHPARAEAGGFNIAESPLQVAFLRGVPLKAEDAARPAAEMFVLVKARPMNSREKAGGFVALLGADRFERLIPIDTQRDDAIRRAAQQLDETRERIKARVPVTMPVESAELALAIAEARGDETKIAEARIAHAETRIAVVKTQTEAGTASAGELLEAEQSLNTARLQLEQARAKSRDAGGTGLENPARP